MTIQNLLFDADGVVQYATTHWQPALQSALGLESVLQAGAVLADVFEAEAGALESEAGFVERLEGVLAKWGRTGRLQETLDVLHAIEVHQDIMQTVQAIRGTGIPCHIASNQQALRARHMSETLNYGSLFDSEFYSCFIGAAKPKARFFEAVVAQLGGDASTVLFLDDRPGNVEAARRAGLNSLVVLGADGAVSLRRQLAGFGILMER